MKSPPEVGQIFAARDRSTAKPGSKDTLTTIDVCVNVNCKDAVIFHAGFTLSGVCHKVALRGHFLHWNQTMQTGDITLRPHRPDEIDALRRIERNAHERYRSLEGFGFTLTAPAIAPERFSTGETIVAEVDNRLSGYILMQPIDGLNYIASIMVEPDLSGRGIGAALLAAAEEKTRQSSLSGTVLATFRQPRWNGPWFRKHGFDSIPEAMIGPGLRAILQRHATFLDMGTREMLWKPAR
ncbi:GNAT family N-acetyltransferase [Neoaquamicrobium sediminum]|uniref:GNAT family N-acetyltransferase n=1 Tax=Neoaquamicrobium sediminum TaxID=1849104 RepID=UPI003BA8F931